ncbi:Decaprenyl diphosphate synthase-like protein [Polystyrenella longa]|uniref:Isoprenyl transferase n=1 Tax=Polystyrenella longa TaxID=2528007 RepID=A0A518CS63_9PLAN|nr:isoprenyl transferase [Polystyrenella longa]QDU82053.1 Decaprenyl diphosphate synthase-like protein [Polystyrenella longa]
MTTVAGYSDAQLQELGLDPAKLPQHIAVIMDGNGRWARSRGLPRIEGHRRGVKSVRKIVEECARLGVGYLTLYCFSSENWKRPQHELNLLMSLLKQYVIEERSEIMRQNLSFRTIGRKEGLGEEVLAEVQKTIDYSRDNTGMCLCLALNYGSRGELVDAVQTIAQKVQEGTLNPNEIDEATIADHLYTRGMPDPDLIVRTSGEMRVSNFLLWQLSYAELWVTDKHWPEFRQEELHQALRDYASRDRRFGGLKG